ncbi:MAG: hypothetical protein H7123_00975 [Thermoleophilia bacterium]|nr:hypothetical protein [Thermoleophilia bacterium]
MDSQLNKAHKTNPNVQPSGFPIAGRTGGTSGANQHVMHLHARLCELVEDPQARAELVGVSVSVDAAWSNGRMLPVLNARRKTIERVVAELERAAAADAAPAN